MTNATAPYQDPQLQTLRINDFSPGVRQWAVGGVPLAYTPNAPLGSASLALRCINKPGVGLVPFYKYNLLANVSSVNVPDAAVTCTGLFAFGPVMSLTTIYPQGAVNVDQLFVSLDYVSGGNRYRQVTRVNSDFTQDTLLNVSVGTAANFPYRFCPDFVVTRIIQNGAPSSPPCPVVAWPELNLHSVYLTPAVGNAAYPLQLVTTIIFPGDVMHLMAHESRLIVLSGVAFLETSAGNQVIYSDEDQFTSDPPESYNIPLGFNTYDPEHFSGFGAWGSISSGELLVIHRGGGAILIEGDARAPSGVVKLPGVAGTGRVMQKGALTAAGLVYVTENDGVYTWNGGNMAQKISQQIPDNACVRAELFVGAGSAGCLSQHDQLNNLVFFANNWVYDVVNQSWWRCEDPAVVNLECFSRSAANNVIYASTGQNLGGNPIALYQFQATALAATWEWMSTPIPVGGGGLATIEWVEIVASSLSVTASTITVTPKAPPGATGIAGNNPQSVTFNIPAGSSGLRLSARLGYTDYNVQLDVAASTTANHAAPVLHEISIGYSVVSPSGVS